MYPLKAMVIFYILDGWQAIVTEEDGMESIAHRFLSAALKVQTFLSHL